MYAYFEVVLVFLCFFDICLEYEGKKTINFYLESSTFSLYQTVQNLRY